MGNLKVCYCHDNFGAGVESDVRHEVDANTTREETTTLGINLSRANDFTVPVKMADGTTIFLRPDSSDELLQAARMAKNIQASSGGEFGLLTVLQGSKEIGRLNPDDLLSVFSIR